MCIKGFRKSKPEVRVELTICPVYKTGALPIVRFRHVSGPGEICTRGDLVANETLCLTELRGPIVT